MVFLFIVNLSITTVILLHVEVVEGTFFLWPPLVLFVNAKFIVGFDSAIGKN